MPLEQSPPLSLIEQELLKRFRLAAVSPEGLFSYPTGRQGLSALGYPEELLQSLPERVVQCYCGVGNPFATGFPEPGERVLDIGCGVGVDALIAASFVGPAGRVDGLELSADMLARAGENLRLSRVATVHLHQGGAEQLPFAPASFDRVISNGVYNLVENKPRALAEAFRVLRPGGWFQVADQIKDADGAALFGRSCPLPPPGSNPQAVAWAN